MSVELYFMPLYEHHGELPAQSVQLIQDLAGVKRKLPPLPRDRAHSSSIIPAGSNNAYFDALQKHVQKHGKSIPKKFSCYKANDPERDGETMWGDVTEDSYGDKLKMLTVHQLLEYKREHIPEMGYQSTAAWAYLSHLHPDHWVVLWWG